MSGTASASSGEALRDELAQLTLELCRIPSETGFEEQIADHVESVCVRAAGESSVTRIGNSVICDPAGGSATPGTPTIALVGHLDTVRCASDQPVEIRDGRVYGCGASDMKAGVANMIALLHRRSGLTAARPVWIFYDKEEGPHAENGLGPVLDSGTLPPLDLAVVLEPTDRALQMGCMGTMHGRLTVRGTRAHSARPWQGENAIYRAIPLLARLADLKRREVTWGPLTFYEVMVATRAWTENSANVVPDRLMLNVNVRFAPGRSGEDAVAELRALVGDAADVEITDIAPSGKVSLNHPLIEPWRTRNNLSLEAKQAWTDVARFTERGVPAFNFGPGETGQAHQAGEWCSIESLEHNFTRILDLFTHPVDRTK
ncbi:MAG: succinyl-diaminopimelate desuccinylase [Gemmatimonadota bacterium]|jgi:succinyl-diaminopimelate desuccinylase|nr:succinyl-diaminopimelate desuccinylase [Gemmatimonadota bacterium]